MDFTNRIICGDCLEVASEWPAQCFDGIVTDPPWMDYSTGWYDATGHHAPVTALQPALYLPTLFRLVRSPGAMVLWCRWDVFNAHAEAATDAGWQVRNQIVWAKPNHTAGDLQGNLGFQHECAIFAVRGNWKRHGARETNLWLEGHLFSRAKRHHPTEKPLGLMARSVKLTCPPHGIVLDPFCGSGTTCVAARQTGRSFCGIELNPDYVKLAEKRLREEVPLLLGDAQWASTTSPMTK